MSDEDDGRVHVLLRGSMKLLSDDRNVTRRSEQPKLTNPKNSGGDDGVLMK